MGMKIRTSNAGGDVELDRGSAGCQAITALLEEKEEELASARRQLDEKHSINKTASRLLREGRAELERVEGALYSKTDALEDARKLISEMDEDKLRCLEASNSGLRMELAGVRSNLDEAVRGAESFRKRSTQLFKENDDLREIIVGLESSDRSWETHLRSKTGELARKEKECVALKEKLALKDKDIEEFKESVTRNILERGTAEAQKRTLEHNLKKERKWCLARVAEIADLKEENSKHKNRVAPLESDLDVARKQRDELRRENSGLTRRLHQSNATSESLLKKHRLLGVTMCGDPEMPDDCRWYAAYGRERKEKEAAIAKLDRESAQNAEGWRINNVAAERIDNLAIALKEKEAECKSLSAGLDRAGESNALMARENIVLIRETVSLKEESSLAFQIAARATEDTKTIARLRKELFDAHKGLEAADTSNDELREIYRNLNEKYKSLSAKDSARSDTIRHLEEQVANVVTVTDTDFGWFGRFQEKFKECDRIRKEVDLLTRDFRSAKQEEAYQKNISSDLRSLLETTSAKVRELGCRIQSLKFQLKNAQGSAAASSGLTEGQRITLRENLKLILDTSWRAANDVEYHAVVARDIAKALSINLED